MGFFGGTWPSFAFRGNGAWQLTAGANLLVRADGMLNTSAFSATLPFIYRPIGTPSVYTVPISDIDPLDLVRCRWSTNNSLMNSNGFDECGSICASSFVLNGTTCTLAFTLTSNMSYGIALQIEDFYNSPSVIPMSSVPVQFSSQGFYSSWWLQQSSNDRRSST